MHFITFEGQESKYSKEEGIWYYYGDGSSYKPFAFRRLRSNYLVEPWAHDKTKLQVSGAKVSRTEVLEQFKAKR